jgi:hypothetical protein
MARMLSSAVRSYFWDLLPLSWPATHSGVVIFVCRLIGCASIVGIVAVSIQHGGSISASKVLPFGLLVMTVALPVVTLSLISGQFEIGLSCLLRPSTTGAEDYEGQAFYRGADYLRAAPS